jgi:hypothetical protein
MSLKTIRGFFSVQRDSNVQHVVTTHDVTTKKNDHLTGIDLWQLKISYVFPLMLNGWSVGSATGDIQLHSHFTFNGTEKAFLTAKDQLRFRGKNNEADSLYHMFGIKSMKVPSLLFSVDPSSLR